MKVKFKLNRIAVFCLLLLVTILACEQAPRDVKAEIEKMNEVFMTAIADKDVDAITNLHTEDAMVLPQNHEVVSVKEAIRKMWQGSFEHGMGSLKLTTLDASATGNTAFETGKYQYFEKGPEVLDHGKYIVVWEKVGADWKIARDAWNSSVPRMPRTGPGDTLAVVITTLKAEHMEPMSKLANKVFLPAFNKYFKESKATSRLFRVLKKKDADKGQMIYLIDPYKRHHVHDVKTILSKHYNEEETAKYHKEFKSYVIDQEVMYAVPMPW